MSGGRLGFMWWTSVGIFIMKPSTRVCFRLTSRPTSTTLFAAKACFAKHRTLHCRPRNTLGMVLHEGDDEEWEKASQPNWRGLGLTDPVKSVEVCS